MLRSLNEIRGYRIRATDQDLGKVHDFYFDDRGWFVRYLVVDTGRWLPGRKVLLSPESLGRPEWRDRVLKVSLSKKQVESAPSIAEDQPVSRQYEERLQSHYGWMPWWPTTPGLMAPAPREIVEQQRTTAVAEEEQRGDPDLRSAREVEGYRIRAKDGEIGHVEDFVLDDEGWALRYLVIDTRNFLPGKKVLVSPQWVVAKIRWADRQVAVDLSRDQVRGGPEFRPEEPINREYEVRLYDWYGRPKYWES